MLMKLIPLASYIALVWFCMGSSLLAKQPPGQSEVGDMTWLSNSSIIVGLKKSSGGAIAWIGSASGQRSLINSHDRGRLVQQSWYGQEDGSLWNKSPWRWNPVQGGDWRGKSASIVEQRHGPTTSFVRTRPVHWATGEDLEDCDMQQTITLNEEMIHVHYRFKYEGSISHTKRHQELPAFFVDASLDTLVTYDGDAAWSGGPVTRRQPNFPNEYGRISEHWAAYVDGNDHGIGLFVPSAEEATFYRYPSKVDRNKKAADSWCSYVAPIRTLAVERNFEYSYDVWITMGSLEEIRQRFKSIALGLEKK